MTVAALHTAPHDADREALLDDLVGLVRGVIQHRVEEKCYGPLAIDEAQRDELARAIVGHVVLGYQVDRRRT